MTKDEFKEHIQSRIQKHFKSISIDGSSWDSSQFPALQWVESHFLKGISSSVLALIKYNHTHVFCNSIVSPESIHANIMRAFADTLNHIFIRIPGI